MKILRVAQKIYPDVKGGAPYHIHAMSRDQAALGHDVTILTIDRGSDLRRDDHNGYRIVRHPSTIELLGNEISVGLGRYLHRADEFDVIHAHSHIYFSTVLAAIASRITNTPLVITNHGLYSQSAPESVFEIFLRTVGWRVLNTADTVLSYTEAERELLREYGIESPITVVPNGINIDMFTPVGPASDRVSGDPAVLFVGRLVDGKRPIDAVEAVARLQDRRPGTTLTVCGSGPRSVAIKEKAKKLGIADAIRQLGQVPYEKMPQLYRSADVLILPSRTEGFPRTVIEALASGTPAVTSDLEQLRPVLEGVGATVPVGDRSGFAAALDDVLDGTAHQPRDAVDGVYDWEKTVAQTTAVLRQVSNGDTPALSGDQCDKKTTN